LIQFDWLFHTLNAAVSKLETIDMPAGLLYVFV
jgi:hypothetical protein